MRGKVKTWLGHRGFGFTYAKGREYSIHATQLIERADEERIAPGATVEFDEDTSDPRGPRAVNVRVVDSEVPRG
jgi:cold shock CspA family protein